WETGNAWQLNENLQLAAAAAGKQFFCYNNNNGSQYGSGVIALREYIYASFLMSFSPTSSVLWETFYTTPSELHVYPETNIVPMNPVVSAPSDISALLSGGLYVREYANCYLSGSNVGPCAAVVNSTTSSTYSMPSMTYSYHHTMALSGGGSLDGGTVSVTGSAPPSTVGPETGLVLFK
ncbi:MAG: hypothetical protein JO029_08560, partial [Candidatus Eremiobacteraeota bacterium]|nr:hypothetical protein [Candidatus Eremiobacteraeota bacterium]